MLHTVRKFRVVLNKLRRDVSWQRHFAECCACRYRRGSCIVGSETYCGRVWFYFSVASYTNEKFCGNIEKWKMRAAKNCHAKIYFIIVKISSFISSVHSWMFHVQVIFTFPLFCWKIANQYFSFVVFFFHALQGTTFLIFLIIHTLSITRFSYELSSERYVSVAGSLNSASRIVLLHLQSDWSIFLLTNGSDVHCCLLFLFWFQEYTTQERHKLLHQTF